MIKSYKIGKNCYIRKDIIEEFKIDKKIVCFIELIYSTDGSPNYYFLTGKPSDKENNFKMIFKELNEAIKQANNYLYQLNRIKNFVKN